MTKHRLALGERGELVASWFLGDHGMRVVDRNVAVGSGELDILATDGATRVVVEVRTTQTPLDPIDAVDAGKRRRVHELARLVGADRVDFIGVGVNPGHVDIHWVPGRP